MRRLPFLGAALTAAAVLVAAADAKALRIAIPNLSPTQRTIQADTIVVGKVTGLEKELVEATQYPGAPQKIGFQIATIKIDQTLAGAKGLTVLRVGFQPAPNVQPVPPQPGGPVRPFIRPRPFMQVTLQAGQEGCFFLRKHHDGEFYVIVPNAQPLDKKADTFQKDLDAVKRTLKVVDDPMTALKSKDAADRAFAATTLVQKYRQMPPTYDGKPARTEPVPAEESKLILKAIGEMEWNTPFNVQTGTMPPQNLFFMLGVTPEDGWKQPAFNGQGDFNKVMQEAIHNWLKANGDKYRIQRYAASAAKPANK